MGGLVFTKKPKKRTWILRFREVLGLKTQRGGLEWLEKESLLYRKMEMKKGNMFVTVRGAKMLVKANLTYIAEKFFTPKEVDHLKKVIGTSKMWRGYEV